MYARTPGIGEGGGLYSVCVPLHMYPLIYPRFSFFVSIYCGVNRYHNPPAEHQGIIGSHRPDLHFQLLVIRKPLAECRKDGQLPLRIVRQHRDDDAGKGGDGKRLGQPPQRLARAEILVIELQGCKVKRDVRQQTEKRKG